MSVLRTIGIVVLLLVLAAFGFYAYMGGLRSVTVEETTFGPVRVIFTTHRGSYSGLGPSWEKFSTQLKNAGIADCDALAFYLDPPGTPEAQLRSVLACRAEKLSPEQMAKATGSFRSFALGPVRSLHASFPFRNFFSFMLGPMKVYPAFHKKLDAKAKVLAAVEVYGSLSGRREIHFYMPQGAAPGAFQPLADAFQ